MLVEVWVSVRSEDGDDGEEAREVDGMDDTTYLRVTVGADATKRRVARRRRVGQGDARGER